MKDYITQNGDRIPPSSLASYLASNQAVIDQSWESLVRKLEKLPTNIANGVVIGLFTVNPEELIDMLKTGEFIQVIVSDLLRISITELCHRRAKKDFDLSLHTNSSPE